MAKRASSLFINHKSLFTCPLKLIHSDVWGPSIELSINGSRYFVSFIGNLSRFTWIYLLAYKSDVPTVVSQFKPSIGTLLSSKASSFEVMEGVSMLKLLFVSILNNMVLHIKNLVLIHPNKMVLLNKNTVTLLKWPLFCCQSPLFL